jgi:mannose-6-phosphate isomerase-like protein (cupin superfamily)
MSDYTIKNLKSDVANAAEQFGVDGMEARFARRDLELGNFGVSYQKLEPNFRQPFGHRHGEQEEAYVVVAGSGRVKVEDDVVDLEQWDAIRVPGSAARQFESGPDGLEYVAIGAPQADDTEMLEGWWSD